MAVDFRKNISNPYATDIGNKTIQGMTASKTVQFGMFTTNANAVWGAKQQLQKESYPFAFVSFPANRDVFRYQVGDVFLFSLSKYGITDMVCRVLQIEEESLGTENIVIHAMQDIYSATNVITEYTDPVDNTTPITDYTISPILYQKIVEAPQLVSDTDIGIIPLAARISNIELGYILYMSSDGGSSYTSIGTYNYFAAYGTLVKEYTTDRYQVDDVGMTVDFVNDDIENFESLTRQDMLGLKNLAIINDEIMTIQNIIPVSGSRYQLTGIYGGRFDTIRGNHSIGDGIFIVNGNQLDFNLDTDLLPETSRKFKFVPYNVQKTGDIADSLVTNLDIGSRSRKPQIPENLRAGGLSDDPYYYDDVVLTWSPRVREIGAGVFAPVSTDKAPTWEGYFAVKVYVSDVLVRTTTAIDDDTWTYTEAMNISDNTSLASEIVFKLYNYLEYDAWIDGVSDLVNLTVRKA